MTSAALLSAVHMIGLAMTLGSIFMRARYFRQPLDAAGLKRLFIADNFWGISAIIMISTGLTRGLSSLEKGRGYYTHSTAFWVKMGLLGVILLLELLPMVTLITWRVKTAKAQQLDLSRARLFAIISDVQTLLALCMIFFAAFMARGH